MTQTNQHRKQDHDLELNKQKIVSYDANLKIVGDYDDSTIKLFTALQDSYNYFKAELFTDSFTPVILTLNRNVRSMGYYRPFSWLNQNSSVNKMLPEININPKILQLPTIEIFSTLIHEMCHHHQYLFGKPGTNGYHNIEFSRIMFSKGLMCSSTGMPGGKVTGRRMSDYVIEGGLFMQKFELMPREFLFPFTSCETVSFLNNPIELQTQNLKERNKIKYTCPICNINAWGKPLLHLICGDCNKKMTSSHKLF